MPNGEWHAVNKQIGTIDKPQTENHLVSKDIFKEQTKSSDIIQGGFGTCCFLAHVNSVVDKDPNQIKNDEDKW